DAELHAAAVQRTGGGDDRVAHAGGLLRNGEPLVIRLGIHEAQRIGRDQIGVELFAEPVIQQHAHTGARVNAEMPAALRADLHILLERLAPDNLAAVLAFLPQALGADLLFAFRRSIAER